MTNFVSSSNPYTIGLKNKSFFAGRRNMLTQEQKNKDVNPNFYPKKDVSKFENTEVNPYTKGLIELVPWVLAASFVFFALV